MVEGFEPLEPLVPPPPPPSNTPAGRLQSWAGNLGQSWRGAVGRWLANVLSFGFDVFFKVIGQSAAPKFRPLIDKMEAAGEIPPELKPLIDELKEPTGEVGALLASSAGYALVGGAISKIIDAMFLRWGYVIMGASHPIIPTEEQALKMWVRGVMDEEQLDNILKSHGAADITRATLKALTEIRLDAQTVSQLWLRDPALYEPLWKDVADQGVTPARIAFLKELAHILPPLADMVRFADFGAFDPAVIEMWREFYDAPGWITEPMSKIGITGDWANKYWFSHWRQPGRFELGELHKRGQIDDATVKNAYLTQGYSSFWQDKLLELVKEVPTRVDIRRWWDMRVIDEAELRELYHAQGYYGRWLDLYVLWTKVYVAFPDLVTRWQNGWINLDDVRSELVGLGMPTDRVEEMIQTKLKAVEPERTANERDLTKAEIVKGVKKEYITWGEGIELLMELGYDEAEADYILAINVAVLEGSPETLPEFKELTAKWRRSAGKEAPMVTEQLKSAANKVVELTKEIEAIKASIKEEEGKLVDQEILPSAATECLDALRVTLHRAESALELAKSEYDRIRAILKHSPPSAETP